MASGTVEANSYGAVIDVFTAVISSPTIDADTGMTADSVEASTPIMAGIWLHETLVDILGTVLPWRGYKTNVGSEILSRIYI